jgi:hypothetical protein
MAQSDPINTNDFTRLEKAALKEISLDIIKSNLQGSLKEIHQKSMVDVERRISSIETRCVSQIQETLERDIKAGLEAHFQTVVKSCEADIGKALSPLVKKAEEEVNRLGGVTSKTNEFCQGIESRYALRWGMPYLTLILVASLSGAIMGLVLFFLQVPFVSVLLMNEQTRAIYDIGVNTIVKNREERDKEAQAQSAPASPTKKKKASK